MDETYALIPAAGRGERFHPDDGANTPADRPAGGGGKLFAPLRGRPFIVHTLLAFERCEEVTGLALVGGESEMDRLAAACRDARLTKQVRLVAGGPTRQESVRRGLLALPPGVDVVAIHDAARPLVTPAVISRTIRAARDHGAALATVAVVDTLKRIDGRNRVLETIPRTEIRAAQTPQTFRTALIRDAHERAYREGISATDDASLVEWSGHPVHWVEGDRRNIKITVPEDLLVAEALMIHSFPEPDSRPADESTNPDRRRYDHVPRVGLGYDIHRLVEGRPLVLGGVEIPFEKGLSGHSDADVLLHALMDALLGAAGLPDIGHLFPNNDARWRGVSSRVMLREVAERLEKAGFAPASVDLVLIAERPKIAPYLVLMRSRIAEDLRLPGDRIGIKATTNEAVGAVGREEAMAAQAVALVVGNRW